eukprot:TRINITY_DN67105_c0_g1_i1.p1 TRINITY_DN67105_c0_g1~~TRINITY_DN67105_c0_g1_i1.p1  ORF type:complete len:299 (+),score=69.18 TRINITY_DN67105_c0_g1_i1:38-934(+)
MAPVENGDVEKIIFVDVDGVLNVGIQDGSKAPLLLCDADVKTAMRIAEKFGGSAIMSAAMLSSLRLAYVFLAEIGGGEDGATFQQFSSNSGDMLSQVLVDRLALLLTLAGDHENVKVVLSSSWRLRKNAAKQRKLEAVLSKVMGRRFKFDFVTAPKAKKTPSDRLSCIGDFLEERRRLLPHKEFQVLVLDDFFIQPMDGFSVHGHQISSVADAERYLEKRGLSDRESAKPVQVKVVHTYRNIKTEFDVCLKLGCGLTKQHFLDAVSFLGEPEAKAKICLGNTRVLGLLPPSRNVVVSL